MGRNKKIERGEYDVILPSSGRGKKEFDILFQRRRDQTIRAIDKLRFNPKDLKIKGIEKLSDSSLDEWSIRVSKGDRIFYDVDKKNVYILRAGKHDLYKL